jgi:hypothetical protein
MERRWRETAQSLHAVYAYRHLVARHVGDVEAAQRWYLQWCAAPRDELSDCDGCDPSSKVYWLAIQGRDEEAVAMAEPVLSGRLTCTEQPQDMLSTVVFPYLRTGRLDQARDAHRRAYRVHRSRLADLEDIGVHIQFCARTGNEARAVEIVQRHLGWLDRAPSPWAGMVFAASCAQALRRAQERLPATLTLRWPGVAAGVGADEVAEELGASATATAAEFDRRNGTDRVGTAVRDILEAEPLVDHLPLGRTGDRG